MAYNPHAVNQLRFWIATGEITSLNTLTWGCYALRDILGLSGDVLQEFSEWMGDGDTFQKSTKIPSLFRDRAGPSERRHRI